jgi:hypothetical protein
MRLVRLIVLLSAVAAATPSLAQTPAAAPTPAPVSLLVDVAWLAQHINDRNLVVLHVDDEAAGRRSRVFRDAPASARSSSPARTSTAPASASLPNSNAPAAWTP